MLVDYKAFIDRVIDKYEGGYGWSKNDPGGPTKYGITCYDLAEHRGQKMTSMATWAPIVHAMPLSEAEDIYQTKYANGVSFNLLPPGVDCAITDYAINSGIGRTNSVVPQLLGVKTYAQAVVALQKVDAKKFIDDLCAERLRFMHAIRGGSAWAEYGRGWGSRVSDLQAYCEHLVAGGTHETAPAAVDLSQVATPKATHVGDQATGKTTASMVAAGVAAQAAGVPWYGVAGACALILVCGLTFEAYSEHMATTANAQMA